MAPLWFYKWCHKGEVVILVIVEVGPLLRSGITWVVGLEWGDNGCWKIRWSLWRVCNNELIRFGKLSSKGVDLDSLRGYIIFFR